MKFTMTDSYNRSFDRLLRIMDELREKCPWDKKQTIHTLRTQSIEELYELAGAITENDWNSIREELGDILLHIVFYARIGREEAKFDIGDVIESVCNKLVARHPHIYEGKRVKDEQEVKQNWEKLKLKEGRKSVMGGVPDSLPAMVKALRLQDKARQVGFEWVATEDVLDKVQEELGELKEAQATQNKEDIEAEFGDLLFSIINYSRYIGIDPENALERTNKKFKSRFQYMESAADQSGRKLHDMTLEEMDSLWNDAKNSL